MTDWQSHGPHVKVSISIPLLVLGKSILKKAYLFTEGEQVRGTGRERIPSGLLTVHAEPDMGLEPTNREIMTWAETESQMLNWLSHPGAPG